MHPHATRLIFVAVPRAAGVGVLMANANEATRAAVEGEDVLRTTHIEDEGFARAVRKYVLEV